MTQNVCVSVQMDEKGFRDFRIGNPLRSDVARKARRGEKLSRAEMRRNKENPRRGGRMGGARQGEGVRKLARTSFRQAGN